MKGNKRFSKEQIKFAKEITEFVRKGSEIIMNANTEHLGKWRDDDFIAVEAHQEYMLWKIDVADFLQNKHIKEWQVFRAVDSVPFVKGGMEYSYRDSEKTQKLLKNIREEATKKLMTLREVRDYAMQSKPKRHEEKDKTLFGSFYLDIVNGELRRLPKEVYQAKVITLEPNSGRFKVMKKLIEEKARGNHFSETGELARIGGYDKNKTCRTTIGTMRKKIADVFGVCDKEFIDGTQNQGYRIGDKINIALKEDTP